LLARGPLEVRVFHAPAQYVGQMEVLAGDAQVVQTLKSLSSVALLEVSQLLDDALEALGQFARRVMPEPCRLDEHRPMATAAERRVASRG
jgi:hypothetical protein